MADPQLRAVFDRVAQDYERYERSPVARRILQLVVDRARARLRPGARIADVGCGPGSAAVALAAAGFRVSAFDISEPMLQTVRRRADAADLRIEAICHDIMEAPLPGEPYDAVLAAMGPLNYVPDPSRMMRNLRSSIHEGGAAWLALARGASFPSAYRRPKPWLLPVVRPAPVRLAASVRGAPFDLFVWDPRRFLEVCGTGWRLEELRGLGLAPRLPEGLDRRLERIRGLRRWGSVSFLELRA